MIHTVCTSTHTAYGIAIRFTAESPELLKAMQQCIPWQQAEHRGSPTSITPTEFFLSSAAQKFHLTCNGILLTIADDLHDALAQLAREAIIHVADHTPDRVFIHAGVVASDGGALLLPGRSFAGKSTLVAALVRAGATYYSDEYAILDEEGFVHPYARALSLREPGSITQREVTIAALAGRAGTIPIAISHVVFTEYSASAIWHPEPITPGAAILGMMQHAIAVQRAPERVMCTLARAAATAFSFRSARGDASHTAALLLQMMSRVPRP